MVSQCLLMKNCIRSTLQIQLNCMFKFVGTSTVIVKQLTQYIYSNQYYWSYYLNCLCKHGNNNIMQMRACTLLVLCVGTSKDSTSYSLLKTCPLDYLTSSYMHLCLFSIWSLHYVVMSGTMLHMWVCNFRWKHSGISQCQFYNSIHSYLVYYTHT